MAKRGTYFLLNKKEDFLRGSGEGILIGEDGISLGENAEKGIYRTRILDGGERGTQWHRLLVQGSLPAGSICVRVYAAETREGIFRPEAKQAEYRDPADVLFDGVAGRYLMLEFCLMSVSGGLPLIGRIKIFFPRQTWLDYLPEVYGEDRESASFLARYLGIFQSLYEDMTERIDRIPERLTPDTGDERALYELADWLGIEGKDFWNVRQLRYLVKNAARLSQIRGTAAYLKELIFLATGRRAYVVEYCGIQPFFDGAGTEEKLRRLYASHPFEFAVLFERRQEGEEEDLYLVGKVVEMSKPAYMECRIIALSPYIFLDQHSYLGMNSALGRYRPLSLDGKCAVPFSVVAGEGSD